MRATRVVRLWLPGAQDVPAEVKLTTPPNHRGQPVASLRDALDWEDSRAASYLQEVGTIHARQDIAIRDGDAGKLTALLQNLEERGCDIGPMTVSKAISLYNNYRATGPALRLYYRFSSSGRKSNSVFTATAAVFASVADLKGVRGVLEEMQASGAEPDLGTYHALLRTFAKGRHEAAAFRAIQALAKTRIRPDPHTVHLLMACCRSYMRGREVFESVAEGRWGEAVRVDAALYNSLLGACAFRGEVGAAKEVLVEMDREEIARTHFTYNAFLNVCRRAKDMRALVEAFREVRRRQHAPDQVFFVTFMTAIAEGLSELAKPEHAQWVDIAEAAFQQAFEEKVVDSGLHFTALARVYAATGDAAKLDALRERCTQEGYPIRSEFVRLAAVCYRQHHAFDTLWAPIDGSLPHVLCRSTPDGRVHQTNVIPQPGGAAPAAAAPPPPSAAASEDWYVLLNQNAEGIAAVEATTGGSPRAPPGEEPRLPLSTQAPNDHRRPMPDL
eukprot:TRINITY_DN4732_c0_g5_i1.p2 TRINITY_DN4732_c0_g5~~TRINITY_DN4732_c0_g5_i1.p2  ORF type:complete len:500 (+),score=180.08 TRINITY_DN4732_c0_g5_i1:342-1841(+)